MYRGRGGPRQSTPANVQCQKCLKRGHYSYECKESSQARPYVSRPSRTQQLRNPKLMPALTNDKPEELMRKKGVADEELAKKEAERAKQRPRDDSSDDEGAPPKRQRSASFDSVSTVSTRHSRSPSPPPRRRSPSPLPQPRHDKRGGPGPSRRRDSPEDDYSRSRSRSPARKHSPADIPQRRQRSFSRDSHSPPPRREQRYRERSADQSVRSGRSLSRSPVRQGGGPAHPRGRAEAAQPVRRQEPPRERSLSPFSQRVALTRSMNQGR
ncbi:zinc knuckle-domain-containing protein [Plectosphaerella plurivora]|uniref:Zinc knuckle-domain-containing protein n=1 Tax=Plectosphaerella plurivora TaxID=936078 RepID=A0A9P8VEN7_9PEZI|nr:zinc knuckle-domain-containing protein [Plectosphaerella plurivora]